MTNPRRSLWTLIPVLGLLLATLIFGVWYYLQSQLPQVSGGTNVLSNVGVFVLINLNIIFVLVFGFLVIKNLVKLVLERRRKILGSRLRSRLVVAFVGLSLVPTVLLLLVAKGIVESVLQGWFSPQIESSVDGALGVAQYHYRAEEIRMRRYLHQVGGTLSVMYPPLLETDVQVDEEGQGETKLDEWREVMRGFLEEKREEYGLSELLVVKRSGEVVVRVTSPDLISEFVEIPGPNLRRLLDSMDGWVKVQPEQSINGEFIRGYAPIGGALGAGVVESSIQQVVEQKDVIEAGEKRHLFSPQYGLVATVWLRPELSETLGAVINAYEDYQELQSYSRPLASSYTLTLVGVTLMIVFAAVWVGFYLAKSLAVPIQELAQGTEQIAHGNLDYRIPSVGDDELGILVRSFNTMTEDLKKTTSELVSRRRYMETMLASVGVGVISIDRHWVVKTCNVAGAEMLGAEDHHAVLHQNLMKVLPDLLGQKVSEMIQELYESREKIISSTAAVVIRNAMKHMQVTATKLLSEQGDVLGAVLLLDDFTELVSAQRMAAWQEVARRIAHEIKNPLTPIQLSAERLQRKLTVGAASRDIGQEEKKLISECTETIVSQVETLRTLVNEFSQFARMPRAVPGPVDLNALVLEKVNISTGAHANVVFETNLDENIPVLELDREQMGRVLVNLLENAVSAAKPDLVQEKEGSALDFQPQIHIRTHLERDLGLVSIEVSDNGLGVPERDKKKLFEPYYSTKKGGTGLGLAIVSSIVADHNGFIRVRDNRPRGARFIVELPVSRRAASLTRDDGRQKTVVGGGSKDEALH